ncbi:hypothetical protein [Carboxylicivirga taeanensis]|uniref:hypothetical protein n=1 Tax=Carboxylicivirga taeanensis TaxID=1416875 RepID=UPI003F6E3F42
METRIIDNHPSLKNSDERFKKMLDAMVVSFQIEGIHFSDEELQKMAAQVEDELKK